jgi:hypothetical protein
MNRACWCIVTVSLGLLCGLVRPLAAETTLAIEISRYGETTVYESGNPSTTLEGSLENLAYGMGWQQFRLDPVTLLLGSLMTSRHNSLVNRAAIEEFLATNDPRYNTVIAGFQLPTRRVDPDGTLDTPNLGAVRIEWIQNQLRWFGVEAWADENLTSLAPANKRIITRWLEGSQAAARKLEDEFYALHPRLKDTNIVAYYYNLTLADIVRAYAWISQSYDFGGIMATLGGAASWLRFEPLGTPLPGGMSMERLETSGQIFPNFRAPEDLALGASNGAAFTFTPAESPDKQLCVVAGEPHQPSSYDSPGGPLQQMKLFRAYARVRKQLVPFFIAAYPTLPAFAGLHFSPGSGTSGTADPIGAGPLFFVETNGSEYLYEGQWRPFQTSPLTITRNGVTETINRYEVPGFGAVFALVRQPTTGRFYVLTWRQKSPSSFLDGFWSRLRAGLAGDGAAYVAALDRALPFYGEAGCHPRRSTDTPNSARRAYYAMNQGKIDKISDPNSLNPLTVNLATAGNQKIGLDPSTVCVGQAWATSDNGNFRSGCPDNPERPYYQDPGYQTFRQALVRQWATEKLNQPLSRREVLEFATGTDSIVVARFIEILATAIERYAMLHLSAEQAPLITAIGQILRANSTGAVYDTPEQILITYLFLELVGPIISQTVPLPPAVRDYLLQPEASRAAMLESLNAEAGAFLIAAIVSGTNFVMNECLAKGIPTYSAALSMTISGALIARNFAGPGLDSRSNALVRFTTDNLGRKTCGLEFLASSPLKFVALDDEVYYLPFGPNVSPLGFETGLYNSSNLAWGEYWSRHNTSGTGSGGIESYRRFSLAPRTSFPSSDADTVSTAALIVPRLVRVVTTSNRLKGSLSQIKSLVRRLKPPSDIKTAAQRRTQAQLRARLEKERDKLLRYTTTYLTVATPTTGTAKLSRESSRLAQVLKRLGRSTLRNFTVERARAIVSVAQLRKTLATRP